jgi:glycosyltransferase involved in cell wall biosynthesis
VFRIVSCSFLVPVKRIDLIIRGIGRAAEIRPAQEFEWHHIGAGPLEGTLRDLARSRLPRNVRASFKGHLANDQVMSFYQDNPVDVLMNVSQSEGCSVSIQEAASCATPIIATDVGGSPEIVSERNGQLIKADPTEEEVALAILAFLDNPELAARKGNASREVWQERFNADRNYLSFTELLQAIVTGSDRRWVTVSRRPSSTHSTEVDEGRRTS